MRLDRHLHVQITRRSTVFTGLTFAREANAITIIDTGRHLHRQGLVFLHAALTMAARTWVLNLFTRTTTVRAGLLHREETLLHTYLTMTGTGATGNWRSALLGAATITRFTLDHGRHTDLYRGAFHRIFQTQAQVVAQVGTTVGLRPAATTAAEDVTEDITEAGAATAESTTTEAAPAHGRVDTGMTKLVIGGTLLRIVQGFVGLFGFFKLFFGFRVIWIAIRVMLHRQTTVCLFQFRVTGVLCHTEDFVKIALCHKNSAVFLSYQYTYESPSNQVMTK